MYWVAKIFQAAGLGVMAIWFVKYVPNLMPHNIFLLSLAFFAAGWVIQRVCLK